MYLDPSEQERFETECKVVKKGDLYRALHWVGDDPVKNEIEDALEGILDEQNFKKVLAVFNLSTCWKEEYGAA